LRKHRNAAFETDVSVRDPPKQRFDERVNGLTRLARKIRKPLLER
jgi:hypothetical protein